MRDIRKGRCPVCEHNQILESIPAQFGDEHIEVPFAVTYDARWVRQGRNPTYPHGQLKLYVCRNCGFAQWFADRPGEIPVGEEHRTRVIEGPESDGPYR